jgi:undecaprenyl-diphosphatase
MNLGLDSVRVRLGLPDSLGERRGFRKPLLVIAAVCMAGLALDTWLALRYQYLPIDPPLARWVQSADWGPAAWTFGFFSWLAGLKQLVVALLAVVLVFVIDRRAAPLMLCGSLTGVIYQAMNLLIHRPRPGPQLIHVVTQVQGSGYPSGHAAFFTSFSILLLHCLLYRRVPNWAFALGWVFVVLLIAVACIARIYVGAHWPSDVAGGLFLGAGWTALAMATQRLSDPVLEER